MDSSHISYHGKEYPAREIYLNGYSKSDEFWHGEYTVSVTSLNKEIEEALDMPIESPEHTEATWIDDGIFFYVPDHLINAADSELSKYIMDNLNRRFKKYA